MTSDSDELQQLRDNLRLRRELAAEVARAKQGGGMAYRLGLLLYWICLVLAGGWAAVSPWLVTTSFAGDIGQWSVAVGPAMLLYGLGRALRYLLSGE
jgi:hypothetical protein